MPHLKVDSQPIVNHARSCLGGSAASTKFVRAGGVMLLGHSSAKPRTHCQCHPSLHPKVNCEL